MKQNPELEAFEAELKKYMAIETEVSNISPVYNIGEQASGCAGLAKAAEYAVPGLLLRYSRASAA